MISNMYHHGLLLPFMLPGTIPALRARVRSWFHRDRED